jgi:hypothetical protein
MNCEYMLWAVAPGVGVRCEHPSNERDGKLFMIPSRNYSCEHFSEKKPPEQ